MAKGGRRARRRRRLLVGQPRRRDLDRLRENERNTIAPKDESFDDCSFPDADVQLLARLALVAMTRGKCWKAMEMLARRPWGVQALRLLMDARPHIVSVSEWETELDEGEERPGATLLHYAAGFTRPSLVEVLLDAGADPDVRDEHDWTPLGYACKNREHGATVAAHLLGAGADVNVIFFGDRTPLHIAAYHSWANSVEVCKLLIAAGIDVNARNDDGQTALEYAVAHDIPTCVATLLEAGAEVTRGAAKAAMSEGSPRGLQMLIRADRRCLEWMFDWWRQPHKRWDFCCYAYLQQVFKAGGCKYGPYKAGAYEAYERKQRRRLLTIVQRHVMGHRVPPEMSQIIVEYWGHPGGYLLWM